MLNESIKISSVVIVSDPLSKLHHFCMFTPFIGATLQCATSLNLFFVSIWDPITNFRIFLLRPDPKEKKGSFYFDRRMHHRNCFHPSTHSILASYTLSKYPKLRRNSRTSVHSKVLPRILILQILLYALLGPSIPSCFFSTPIICSSVNLTCH